MKRLARGTVLASILLVVSLLAACSSSSSSGTKPSAVSGGTATFALAAGNVPDWILPLVTAANATTPNISFFQFLLYRPLFWFGGPGSAGLNESPTFTTSNGKTTAHITLKHYVWSDGKPVTARDVQFWYNLLTAEKANWWDYSPGGFPDNVVRFSVNGPYQITIEFNGPYSGAWLYNELAQLVPLPQQSWDRTSATGPVGNYDLTTSGARAVYGIYPERVLLRAQCKERGSQAAARAVHQRRRRIQLLVVGKWPLLWVCALQRYSCDIPRDQRRL